MLTLDVSTELLTKYCSSRAGNDARENGFRQVSCNLSRFFRNKPRSLFLDTRFMTEGPVVPQKRLTRMHSSRIHAAHSSSHLLGGLPQCMLGYPPGCGPRDPPQVWAWQPSRVWAMRSPAGCGPGDPLGRTPQLPPWVWTWRPSSQPARPLNFPTGCGPGDLQCMLGYHPPPRGQNDRQVQKYYLAPNFVCGR